MKFSLVLFSVLLVTPHLDALEIAKVGERWCGMGGYHGGREFVESVTVTCDDLGETGSVGGTLHPLRLSVSVWHGSSVREVIIRNPGNISMGDLSLRTDFDKIRSAVVAKLKQDNIELPEGAALNIQSVQLAKTEKIFDDNEELVASDEKTLDLQIDEKQPNANLMKCAHAWNNLDTLRYTELFTYSGGKNSDPLIVLPPSEDDKVKRDIIISPKGHITVGLEKTRGCIADNLKLVKKGRDPVFISHSHCNSDPADGLARAYVEPTVSDERDTDDRFKTVDGTQETIDPESKVSEEVLKRIRNVSREVRRDFDRDILHRAPRKLAKVANALEACKDVKGFYNEKDATKNEMLYFSNHIFPNGYEEFLTKKNQQGRDSKPKRERAS